jgi:antitoxin (DNA-binding transcriptional repressor) of toxin-antitoxin stability system
MDQPGDTINVFNALASRYGACDNRAVMTTLDVHELGKSLAELVTLARKESEVVLVDGSQPVARVLPIPASPAASTQARTLGLHDGAFEVGHDFDAPLPDEFWAGQS